jgi:hypothetical protein
MPSSPTNKYTPTTWGVSTYTDLECPSGQLCQVRQPGIQNLIAAGVLENIDSLTALVDEKHIKRVKNARRSSAPPSKSTNAKSNDVAIDTDFLMQDPAALAKMFSMIDRITCHMVVQPSLQLAVDENNKPIPFDKRDVDAVYVDSVDQMDKMYIFQYAVGGGADLESFRSKFNIDVASMAAQ